MKKTNEMQAVSLPEVFTFNPNNAQIRVQVINNEPWFAATDVCQALSIANSRDAVSRLDDDERATSVLPTQFGDKEMNLLSMRVVYIL